MTRETILIAHIPRRIIIFRHGVEYTPYNGTL